MLTAAGGTDAGSYVSGLNETSLRNSLTGYTTNFLNYLQSNCPNATLPEILSGQMIVPATNTTLPQLAFSQDTYNFTPQFWTDEPTNLMANLSVTFGGTNFSWFMPQLAGQRLALTYDANGVAQLWQDDTLLTQSTNTGTGSTNNVVLSVNHPVGTWDFTNNVLIDNGEYDTIVTNSYQRTNAVYDLMYAFEPDWGWLAQRENKLDAYRQSGLTNTSRQVMSETLNVMGLNWLLQTEAAEQLFGAQLNILPEYRNRLGRMAQEGGKGFYVDAYMQQSGAFSSAGIDTTNTDKRFRFYGLTSYFNSALEHGVIEQMQSSNQPAASTVEMLELASTNGQNIYLTASNNWAAVAGQLTGYGAATNLIYANYIARGYYLLLPQSGSNHLNGAGSWAGYGFVGYSPYSNPPLIAMSISGGYQGGFSGVPGAPDSSEVAATSDSQDFVFGEVPFLTPGLSGGDPVDAATGTFQVEHTDLSLGQAEPRGISLTRFYNGVRRNNNPVGMAGGWTHNYYVNAATVAAAQPGLGGTTPAQAASMIVASCAAIGIYNDLQLDPKNWTVTALIAKWAIDQLIKNGVSVNLGKDLLQFVKQPNGVFTPPANCTMTLTQSNALYSLSLRHGNRFNFDAPGRLASVVDPYGVSLAVTYLNSTSSLPYQVTDWKNRTLTFTYTNGQLAA